jgi:ABC-type phosphate transport system substrate-binding protein
MKSFKNSFLATLTLGLYVGSTYADELVVIVNPNNPTASITIDQVEQIYLGKATTLLGSGNAMVADLPEGSPARDEFYQKAVGKSAAQVRAIWARLLFSGRGSPPKALASSAEVKKFVASAPNSIGYIEKSAVDSSVKVVLSLP